MASEYHQAALVLVGQELEALVVLERVKVFIFLVEKNRIRFCERVKGLEDGVERLRAFCSV